MRPISLRNFVLKLITKMMTTNGMQSIMPYIIAMNQCAFVKGRNIFDAILMANELVSDYKMPNFKNKFCLKANLSKVYDSVRWDYICLFMQNMGFPAQWIE